MDDTKQMAQAREQLNQFRVVKMVLLNFAIKDRNRLILTSDITYDVLDEMRRERKILMAIRDAQIEKYIGLDITDIDMADKDSHADLNQEILFAIQDKAEYREVLSQRTSTMRLNYMYMVLLTIFQRKCTIADPDQYIDKVKALERSDRNNELKRNGTDSSMFSIYSKSQKTGITGVDDGVTENTDDDEVDETATNTTAGVQNDPVILGLQ